MDNEFTTRVKRQTTEAQQQSLEETAGIPTGLAPDIHAQIEIRRAKRKAAPDNLAPETPESPA